MCGCRPFFSTEKTWPLECESSDEAASPKRTTSPSVSEERNIARFTCSTGCRSRYKVLLMRTPAFDPQTEEKSEFHQVLNGKRRILLEQQGWMNPIPVQRELQAGQKRADIFQESQHRRRRQYHRLRGAEHVQGEPQSCHDRRHRAQGQYAKPRRGDGSRKDLLK